MLSTKLIQWDGPAAILGGLLWLLFFILQATAPAALNVEPYTVTNPVAYIAYNLMFLLSVLLFVIALLGLYARQAERAGAAGKAGAALAVLGGMLFITGGVLSGLFDIDGMWYLMMVGVIVLSLSLVVLGAATLRTQALRRWSFVPLFLGALGIASFLSAFLGLFEAGPLGMWMGIALPALTGAGWVLLGYALRLRQPLENAGTEPSVA
jgi:hypothetical protein